MCFSSRMLNVASYLWFKLSLRSSALISSDACRPVWILMTKPTVFFMESFGTLGWLRFSASRLLLCILFWDPSFYSNKTVNINTIAFLRFQIDWMMTMKLYSQFGTLLKTVPVFWCAHPRLSQLAFSVSFMMAGFSKMWHISCRFRLRLRCTLFWTLTVTERLCDSSSRVLRLFSKVSDTRGGAEGSYISYLSFRLIPLICTEGLWCMLKEPSR